MKSAISQPFSVTASKEPISVKSIARYYLTEASGTTPSANDSRWKLVNEGEAVPMPTSAAPYLWKKTVTTFTDGTSSTAIEFAGSLGKNGINGANAFVVDLDNEMDAIPCDSSGYLSSARTFNLNIGAYYGTTSVNLNSVSCTVNSTNSGISINTNTAKSPVITFAAGAYSGTYEFTFTCKHNTYGTRTVVFTVVVQKAGATGSPPAIYNLVPSHTSLSFARDSNGNLTGSYSVTCQVSRTVGSSTSIVAPSTYGLTIKWGWNSTDPCTATYSSALSLNTSSASNTNLVFELYSGSTRIDRETIPIIKDGSKGGTGDPGNGIASVSFARMFTMAFSAPASNASGWIASTSSSYPSESGLSKENRYLWQRKTTTYTRSDVATTYEVSLLAQYESGVCANLLEDTAFNDINDMDAWMEKAGSVALRVFENTNGFSFASISNAAYCDVLKQEVYLSTGIKKLEANTWYTFSFYGAMYASHDIYNSARYQSNNVSPYYQVQNVSGQLYLDNSQSITVDVTGYVASTSVYMCYYIYRKKSDGSWAQSAQCKFTSTSTKTIRMTLTNNSGAAAQYYLGGYVYNSDGTQNTSSATSHRGYINKVVCYRGCCIDTYFYNASGGSVVVADSSAPWICDGTVCNGTTSLPDAGSYPQMNGTWVQCSGDGHVRWQMNPVTKRHYVTFKTVSTLNANQSYCILFRATGYAHSGWICMPKLERNTMPTEWIEHTNDRMAADFQHIYAGEWSSSTAYMYANGVRHVVRAKKSASGEKTFFRLKKRTSSTGYVSTSEPYSDTTYWEQASYLKFVATDLMLADEVITDKLTVSKIRGAGGKFILDADGNVTGIGCVFDKVKVTGSLRNPFSVASDSFDVSYSDNVAVISSGGGWVDVYSLPWDNSQSGRVIRIVNYKWGSTTSQGSASIGAASGKYFFEDGITKSELNISRELITLLGYGDNSTFYGWIVVNRIDLATTKRYGHCLKALAHGTIIGTSSTASLSNVRSFDKSSLSVSRQGVGWYRLTFPSTWFNSAASDLGLILTGRIIYDGTAPAKGSIKTISSTYVDILVSDDDTVNDGTVDFLIYNRDDFGML